MSLVHTQAFRDEQQKPSLDKAHTGTFKDGIPRALQPVKPVTHLGIAFTIAVHCAIVVANLLLGKTAGDDGSPASSLSCLQICATHCALLLGVMKGPGPLIRRQMWWSPKPDAYGALLLFAIGVVHFFGVGIASFSHLEPGMTTYVDQFYFCTVLLTTVGYGNTFVPTSPFSRLFTICFSALGLIVFGAGSSVVSGAIGQMISDVRAMFGRIMPCCARRTASVAAAGAPAEPAVEPSTAYQNGRDLFLRFCAFLVINYVSAAIFIQVEDGWLFVDALYHCFMTATTIGLGDIAPTSQAGRGFAVLHMIFSVLLFGAIIGSVLGALDRRVAEAKKEKMLNKQLDLELITALDKDGGGIDRAEFVLGMLVALGTITEEDYQPFMQQFDALDVNGDKKLDKDDLTAIVDSNRRQAQLLKAKRMELESSATGKVRRHAEELIVPTTIACMGFLWHNLFGYALLLTGLLDLLAITIILGNPPSASTYRKVIALTCLASACLIFVIAFFIFSLAAFESYLDMDPLYAELMVHGSLTDDGWTHVELDPAIRAMQATVVVGFSSDGAGLAICVIYILGFMQILFMQTKVIVCGLGAMREAKAVAVELGAAASATVSAAKEEATAAAVSSAAAAIAPRVEAV